MQPYRHQDIEPVKLRTPINWGPPKRIGQSALVLTPFVGVPVFAPLLIHHPGESSLSVAVICSVFYFLGSLLTGAGMVITGYLDKYANSTINVVLALAWWPFFFGMLPIIITRIIIEGLTNFYNWIVRG